MSYGVMVVKIGGAALDEPARSRELWQALAHAHALRGGRLVLVHGGGIEVDRHLRRLGMTPERKDGIRVTPPNQIAEVVGVLAGRINKGIVGALQAHGPPAVGLCLGDARTARTIRATHYPFDPGLVGHVEGGDPTLLRLLMGASMLPVVCSIGLGENGEALNVNADDAAAALAQILSASLLVLLTDVPGILNESGRLIASTTPGEIESLIARGVIHGGMIPKARAAARAATTSGSPCIIASWSVPADLVRLGRGEAAGTRVLPG